MNRTTLLATLLAGAFASFAQAGTVELNLEVDTVNQTWQATAQITDTTISFETFSPGDQILGIAGFTIDVLGSGGVSVNPTVALEAPTGADNVGSLVSTGFTQFPSTGIAAGTDVTNIGAAQVTFGIGTPDPRQALEGPGLSAGMDGSNLVEAVWDFPLVLASGSYTGTVGTLELRATPLPDVQPGNEAFSLLFGDPTAGASGFDDFADVEFAAVVTSDTVSIPEPASLLLLSLSSAALGFSRRRANAA